MASDEPKRLEAAGTCERVRVLLLTDRPALENVLEFVVQGNTARMNDKGFVDELKRWIRFNGADAARLGDGLFSRSSGNPEVPAWRGDLMFGFFFTPKAENEERVEHLRSSAGIAVFACANLVMRFGRGPTLPYSPCRPVPAVLVRAPWPDRPHHVDTGAPCAFSSRSY